MAAPPWNPRAPLPEDRLLVGLVSVVVSCGQTCRAVTVRPGMV